MGYSVQEKRLVTIIGMGGALDADEVIPDLWLGGHTALDGLNKGQDIPFDVVLSAALEIAPNRFNHGAPVARHIPLDDTPTDWDASPQAWRMVVQAGRWVAAQWASGKKVLVVCHSGINRSSLIVGVALRFLGFSGPAAVEQIRKTRGYGTLTNQSFRNAVLTRVQPDTTFTRER
jgi:protein-tyrosine phosphatase